MYDEYARQLIDSIPDLPEIDRNACRRALSAAYFHIVRSRLATAQDNTSNQDLEETQLLLRRMGDALESIAVFDRLNGTNRSIEVENACAFVAAEAFALLTALSQQQDSSVKDPLLSDANYVAIESALLYMVGGYDINAISIVRNTTVPVIDVTGTANVTAARLVNASYAVSRILALCRGEVRRPRPEVALISPVPLREAPNDYDLLIDEIRAHFYERLGTAVDAYLDWLGGYEDNGQEKAVLSLQSIRGSSIASGYPGYTTFSDIYHLSSLLLSAIDRTSRRSVIHNVPSPNGGNEALPKEFATYLQHRVRGDNASSGRPFLWPSTAGYVAECLPGPNKDAVVAMPTGSGKSFVAELAIAHALASGWVLYLAPTNALAHQVRRDLMRALEPFRQVEVRAFVGSDEYTTLAEEQIDPAKMNFVAVMTPEKCALALRLHPERFANCSLCVFDECHLLNDQQRGVTADILLAQLFMVTPNARFILMSAMVGNAEELAEWLNLAHDGKSTPVNVKWRPSRTMRGLLVIDQDSLEANYQRARMELGRLHPRRVNQKFDVPLAMIAGLSGPWTMAGPLDYRVARLPITFESRASRKLDEADRPQFDSWKNTSSRLLAELFARSGLSTICFILTSKHHAFSSADQVTSEIPESIGVSGTFPKLVEAWLTIAEAELGVETALRNLLRRGIAVHTSAMLQPEQAASEWMFAHQKARLMLATGTLAQGLNLPAISVVIAGTSMGDPREAAETDAIAGVSRANALILNGFGRAGRPGFANQGIAILVSDSPFSAPISQNLNPRSALDAYSVLGEPDAAIEVHSPVEIFLDHVLAGDNDAIGATYTELVLTSLLAEYDREHQHSGQILHRTLAAYHKRRVFTPQTVTQVRTRITTLKREFLQQPNVPPWMNRAAMKAGVGFFRAWRMWSAYSQRGLIPIEDSANLGVGDWLDVFFGVMSLLPPKQIAQYRADDQIKRETVLTRLRIRSAAQAEVDMIPWGIPRDWPLLWQELQSLVWSYMRGASYSELAQAYLGISADQITSGRSSGTNPIPAVFGFLRKVVDPLAIDAGCFLAIHEFSVHGEGGIIAPLPETLQALPLCIRNGCDSLGVLSWYRFGLRQRVCAHALEAAFSVPNHLRNDTERAKWVRQARHEWLAGNLHADHIPILSYAATVIKEGGAA